VNRGLAILGETLFMGTLDAHIIALDARSGDLLWKTKVADAKDRYVITHAPLVVKDKVIVGTAGGDGGAPGIIAEDLVNNLMKQIEEFKPGFTLGERVEQLTELEDGSFVVRTNEDTEVHCKVVVIAAGLGSFEPRKPAVENLEYFEGKSLPGIAAVQE